MAVSSEMDKYAVMVKHDECVPSYAEDEINGESEGNSLSLGRAIRRYPKVAGYAFFPTLAILLCGYDLVIVGTVSSIPAFRMVFGRSYEDRYIIPSSWYAIWQFSSNIGLMAGGLICGWLQDRIRRRWSLFWTSMLISVSVAICYVSDLSPSLNGKRGLFFVAKTVRGVGIGGMMCSTQTWLSEVLPVSLRGPFMEFFPIFKLLRQLIGALVSFPVIDSESPSAYRLCFATQWPFSGLLSILALLLPESPAYLLRKGQETAASKAMLRLRDWTEGPVRTEAAFDQLRHAIESGKHDSKIAHETYRDCFRGPQLRRTLLVGFGEFLPILFSLQLLGSGSYVLQQIGMDPSTSLIFLISGIGIGVIASCICFYTIAKFDLVQHVRHHRSLARRRHLRFTAAGFMVVIFAAGIGVWPASYAVSSESSAIRLRSKSQGIGWLTYGFGVMVFSVVMPYLYNPDAGDIGSYTAFVYVFFAGLAVVLTFFCVPEMKGRSTRAIDRMFDLKLPARKFKRWSDDEAAGLT